MTGPDETWHLLGAGMADILLQVSDDGTILYINRVPGVLSVPEVVGTSIFDYLPPAARPRVRRSLREVFERGTAQAVALPITFASGAVRWYSASAGPVIFGGRVVAAVVVARDDTEQRNAELALRESEARYRTLVEHAPEAIVVLDVDAATFVDANVNASALFGLTREEILRRNPLELSPPVQPDGRCSESAACEYIERALQGEAQSFEWAHLTSTGHQIQCEVRLVRLPAFGRRLVRGSVIDVTSQRRLEGQLQQFQKLDTLGHMAGGIAHDFKNILTVISASAELLLASVTDEDAREDALAIREAAARGRHLTDQIMNFARERDAKRRPVDLNTAVDQATAMLRRLLTANITLRTSLVAAGAPIIGDRTDLDQILVNLVLNARDAMPRGGVIDIATLRGEDGATYTLRVADNGSGMDATTKARALDPFFTTKPSGLGTGLGLSTVAMIVQRYGGQIEIASAPGAGTTIDVVLPARTDETAEHARSG